MDKRISDLEHQVHLLKQKLQIAELQIEIEKKKREKAEQNQRPYNPWTINYGTTAMIAASKSQAEQLTEQIKRRMGGKDGK